MVTGNFEMRMSGNVATRLSDNVSANTPSQTHNGLSQAFQFLSANNLGSNDISAHEKVTIVTVDVVGE